MLVMEEKKKMRTVYLRWQTLLAVAVLAFLLLVLYTAFYSKPPPFSCFYGYWDDQSIRHLDRYCNPLNQPPSGDEGDVSAESYQLVSVHVAVRHGDRYHLHGLPNYDNAPVACRFSDEHNHAVPELKDFQRAMERTAVRGGRQRKQTFHDYDVYPNKATCSPADLTPEGAAQHVRNGLLLRRRYVDKWQLLDASSEDTLYEQVLVRCTTWSRTFQSAVALTYGLLPKLDLQKLRMEQANDNSMCMPGGDVPCECPAIKDYYDVFSCNWHQRSPHMMAQPRVKKVYGHLAEVLGVASNTLPPPSQLMDVAMIHYCHHQPLPVFGSRCLQPWAVRDLYDSVMDNGVEQVANANLNRIVRIKLHPLLTEIARRMRDQVSGRSQLKFVLYSGHDTTIEPLASAMGFSSGIWSRYAARIVLELYTRKTHEGQGFIRVLFDGRSVTDSVSFCRDQLVGGTDLCPLESFLQFVDHNNIEDLGDQGYSEACQKHIPLS